MPGYSDNKDAVLKRLKARLADHLPQLPIHISSHDRDPFIIA